MPELKKLTAIVAMTPERVIGKDNDLPWRLPEDLKMFKRTTAGHPVVMGRKTWDSLGKYKPLPGRQNIVITRDGAWSEDGATVILSQEDLREIELQDEHVFVIGGAQIYELFLPHLDELIVSHVFKQYEGDTKFPEFSEHFSEYEVLESFEEFEVRRYFRT
ncbi:MAG: dihydrofolate reductase [Akkermansiaceae bacterium]